MQIAIARIEILRQQMELLSYRRTFLQMDLADLNLFWKFKEILDIKIDVSERRLMIENNINKINEEIEMIQKEMNLLM